MARSQVPRRMPASLEPSAKRLLGWASRLRKRVTRSFTSGHHDTEPPVALSAFQAQSDAVALPAELPDAVVAKNKHGSYCVPRSALHRPVSRRILDARVWEPRTLDLLRSADPSGDVVHAGTFFGDFIPALARSRAPGARVWAFEPNRESFECARITIMLNELENVVLAHAGLAASSGTALLATSDSRGVALGGGSRLVDDRSQAADAASEEVKLTAIDEVLANDRRVAVVQLDVEGHEQQALSGAMLTIARCRPLLVLETLPPQSWLAEHLVPLGYRVAGASDANTVLRPG